VENHHRHLFDIQHRGKRLSVGVRTRFRRRTYIGAIDGQVCATAPAKGTLLRLLMEMTGQKAAA
jgi:hypothetical protein